MARQIDPWLGVPQTAVLEENLLAVQLRLQGVDIKLRELEARLGRVARAASEAAADADRVNGQTLWLEAQLADVAGAILMLADQLAATGTAGPTPPEDVPSAVAHKVMELLSNAT